MVEVLGLKDEEGGDGGEGALVPDVGEIMDGAEGVDLMKFLAIFGLLLFLEILIGEPDFPGVEEFRHPALINLYVEFFDLQFND